MYIDYGNIDAFFGDYERVVYALSGGRPTAVVHSPLYVSKEGDVLEFLNKIQNGLYWECCINDEKTYIYWEDLRNVHALFDERIGAIQKYGMCKISNGCEHLSFEGIDADDLLSITANRHYRIHRIFKGYRLNRSSPLAKAFVNEEEAFKKIEFDLFHENFASVKGATTRSQCIEFTLIDN